jgi:hypothetical protein
LLSIDCRRARADWQNAHADIVAACAAPGIRWVRVAIACFVEVALFVMSRDQTSLRRRSSDVIAGHLRTLTRSSLADFRSRPPIDFQDADFQDGDLQDGNLQDENLFDQVPVTRSSRFHSPLVDKIRMSVAEHFSESKFSSTSHAVESGNIVEIAVHKSSPRRNNRRASTKPVFLLVSFRQTAMEV